MDRPVRRCSFCRRQQGEVRLVAGPSDVYICHLCVAQCAEILALEEPSGRPVSPEPPFPGAGPVIRTEVISS